MRPVIKWNGPTFIGQLISPVAGRISIVKFGRRSNAVLVRIEQDVTVGSFHSLRHTYDTVHVEVPLLFTFN